MRHSCIHSPFSLLSCGLARCDEQLFDFGHGHYAYIYIYIYIPRHSLSRERMDCLDSLRFRYLSSPRDGSLNFLFLLSPLSLELHYGSMHAQRADIRSYLSTTRLGTGAQSTFVHVCVTSSANGWDFFRENDPKISRGSVLARILTG